jgi:hypothetical protein
MQPILKTTNFPDLFRFLAALQVEVLDAVDVDSVVIWEPEANSSLFTSYGTLEVVNRYAKKLGVTLIVSAASNLQLRQMAQQIGWEVLWNSTALDNAIDQDAMTYPDFSYTLEAIAS